MTIMPHINEINRDKRMHEQLLRNARLIGAIEAHVEMAQKRSPYGNTETPKQAIDAIAELLAEFDAG